MSFLRRLRPGSGGIGPASQTLETIKNDPEGGRRTPRRGLSAPGEATGTEAISWPIALADRMDPTTGHIPELALDSDSDAFPFHEPDDPAVMRKLFGLDV